MPLTHFLAMIALVVMAAALAIWVGLSAGIPPVAFVLVALSAALLVHLNLGDGRDHDA